MDDMKAEEQGIKDENQNHNVDKNQCIELEQGTSRQSNGELYNNGGNSDVQSENEEISGKENVELLLTDLPLEVIVDIFDFLPLLDRYRASISCHILYEAFNHPKLWRTQELLITADPTNYVTKYSGIFGRLPNKSRLLIAKFGKYFQFLTITVFGHLYRLTEWQTVLQELSQQCRLEKLTLQVGKMTTATDLRSRPPKLQDLKAILSFIENAFRMKVLDIKSWPLFPQVLKKEDHNIFKALMRNKKLHDLEQLELFWPYTKQMWSERQPVLPDCDLVLELIRNLTNLRVLGLRSPMLSNAILEELASPERSRKINLLKIFITYAKNMHEFQIPNIRSSSWKCLKEANPDFHVECHVMPQVPSIELGNMLTMECPLSKIVFLYWARIDDQLIESISNKFNKTLKTFVVYCDLNGNDAALIKMVQECKLLENLVIESRSWYGIFYKTVEKLAKLRGKLWKTLQIAEKNISFLEKQDEDDDDVIRRDENGEYYMVRLQNYNTEPSGEERKQMLKALEETLHVTLGSKLVNSKEVIVKQRDDILGHN